METHNTLPAQVMDLTGSRFGRLMVLRYAGRSGSERVSTWLCQCDCGTQREVQARAMRLGRTTSCGCRLREIQRNRSSVTHGLSGTPTYASWCSMLSRCYNPKQQSFAKYGALGVAVCARWRESFEAFLADMGERPAGKTLDRRNPFGNYEADNCRWAPPKQQSNNRRSDWAMRILGRLPPVLYEQLLAEVIADERKART